MPSRGKALSRLDELVIYFRCRLEPHLNITEPMCGFQTPFTLRPPLFSAYDPSTHPDYQRCLNVGEGRDVPTRTLLYRTLSLATIRHCNGSADEDLCSCQHFVSYNFVAFVYYDTESFGLVMMRME